MAIERSVRININTRGAQSSLNNLNRSLGQTERQATASSRAASLFSAAIVAVGGTAAVRGTVQLADSYTNLQNRLRLVTDSTEELTEANERLQTIATDTRAGITGTVDLYARLARSTDTLNVSSERLFNITESVGQAVAISGTTAASAQAALFQLGQGLGAGALRGEELNSVLEQTPRLAQAIADGLGITISQLREVAAQGEITSERVVQALENQASVLEREFGNTTSTISQAFVEINNQLIRYVGESDQAIGATQAFVSVLNSAARNFDTIADTVGNTLVPALGALAVIYTGRLSAAIAGFVASQVRSVAASNASVVAIRAEAAARVTETAANVAASQQLVTSSGLRLANANAIRVQTGNTALLSAAITAEARARQGLIGATAAHTAAVTSYTGVVASSTIATRAFGTALAVVGGPVGAIVIGLGLAVAALVSFSDEADDAAESTNRLATSTRQYTTDLRNASAIQFQNALIDATTAADNARTALESARSEVERLTGSQSSAAASRIALLNRDMSQLEANVVDADLAVTRINQNFSDAATSAGNLASTTTSIIDVTAQYRAQLDQTARINQRYDNIIRDVRRDVSDAAEATELINLAEQNRTRDLERLNQRTETQATSNENLSRSYLELAAQFSPLATAQNRYNDTLLEIAQSNVTVTQQSELRALAERRLNDEIQNGAGSYNALLASLDPVADATRDYNETLREISNSRATEAQQIELTSLAQDRLVVATQNAEQQQRSSQLTSQSFFGSLAQGFNESRLNATSAYDQIREVGNNAFDSLQQGLADFITTGEIDIRSFAANVIAQLAQVAAQQAIISSFSGTGIGSFFGFAEGGAFSGRTRMFAQGGVPSLGAFSNSVVSSPTRFAAGGTPNNVMGEAGPEAILPLTRTSSGNLGVEAVSSGGGSSSNVFAPTVNIQVQPSGNQQQDQQAASANIEAMRRELNQMFAQFTRNQMRNGGQFNPSGGI